MNGHISVWVLSICRRTLRAKFCTSLIPKPSAQCNNRLVIQNYPLASITCDLQCSEGSFERSAWNLGVLRVSTNTDSLLIINSCQSHTNWASWLVLHSVAWGLKQVARLKVEQFIKRFERMCMNFIDTTSGLEIAMCSRLHLMESIICGINLFWIKLVVSSNKLLIKVRIFHLTSWLPLHCPSGYKLHW